MEGETEQSFRKLKGKKISIRNKSSQFAFSRRIIFFFLNPRHHTSKELTQDCNIEKAISLSYASKSWLCWSTRLYLSKILRAFAKHVTWWPWFCRMLICFHTFPVCRNRASSPGALMLPLQIQQRIKTKISRPV